MQGQPSMAATANLSRAEGAAGAGELARAARSLESVQGNVSGQTMAIQQMTLSGQQQATNLNMLLNQLSTQVAGLNQAVMQMASATRMAAMPMPGMQQPMSMGLPGPAIPPPPMMGGGGFRAAMGTGFGYAAQGMSLAGAGLGAFGGVFGRVGAGLAQPFLGAHIYGGPNGPQLGQDVGFMRSLGMATGVGINPDMLRTASASQIEALGRERMRNRFEDAALGTIGGMGHLGLALGGEAIGSGIMGAMGVGGIAGFGGGMLLGGGIAAAGGLAINETMRQTANIRGFGEQFGRNAYRFMDVGGGGRGANGLRLPSRSQRRTFGEAMNRMSIDDLVFNDQDVTEMFAGMSEQDLMRGMRSTQEVVQRMRQAKETFKLIGQQMGQGIQEASQTMGIMQSLGGDPMGRQGRAMIFGASSIPGLMPGEAMGRMGQFGQQFVAAGAGMEGAGLMEASMRIGQGAINRGALSASQIAALGGREGVAGSMANLTAAYAASAMGQASMMGGPGTMGGGIFSTMSAASNRAMDPNRIMEMMGGDLQKEFLGAAGGFGAQADMYAKLKSQADVLKNSLGLTDRNAMLAALRQLDPNMTGTQADAYIKQFESLPEAMRDKQRAMVQQASEQAHSQAIEQFSPWARFKRGAQRAFTPLSENMNMAVEGAGSMLENMSEDISLGLTGRENVNLSMGMTSESLRALRARGGDRVTRMEEEMLDVPAPGTGGREGRSVRAQIQAENSRRKERNRIRKRQRAMESEAPPASTRARYKKMAQNAMATPSSRRKLEEAKRVLEDPNSSSSERRAAMQETLSLISNGAYDGLDQMVDEQGNPTRGSLSAQKAIQEAAASVLGVSPASALIGTETTPGAKGFGGSEKEELSEARTAIRGLLDVTEAQAMAVETPEVQAYIQALASGGDVIGTREAAAKKLGSNKGILDTIDTLQDERSWWDFGQSDFEELASLTTGKKGERLSQLSSRESAAGRVNIMGKSLAGLLGSKEFGRDIGGLGGLGRKDAGENLRQMGRLINRLSSEDLKRLGKMEGGEDFARVFSALQGVNVDDGIGAAETEILSGLGLSKEDIAGIKTQDDLGMAAALAMDKGDVAGLQTSASKKGFTSMQAANMQTMANQLQEISKLLSQMKEHPAFKKGQ